MGISPAEPPVRTTGVARAGEPGLQAPAQRRRPRAALFAGGLVLLAVKASAISALVHHRGDLIAVIAIALAVSILRPRPVLAALTAAPLIALAIAPHSTAVGVGIGFGAFVMLITLCFVISTGLHMTQERRSPRS